MGIDIFGAEVIKWIQWENMKELLRSIFAINYKKILKWIH
jgi:hypothetical protein